MIRLQLDTEYSGQLIVEIYVGVWEVLSDIHRLSRRPNPPPRLVKALVDTGAERTVVEERWLTSLGLSPLSDIEVHTASTGNDPVTRNVYAVELSLAGEVTATIARNLQVIAAPDLSGLGVEALLGRDVLSRGTLIYEGPKRTFTLVLPDEV